MSKINNIFGSSLSFDPLTLNPVYWIDATDISTITKDGSDYISQVDDKSGNNYHLTQSTALYQPQYLSNGIANKGSIYLPPTTGMQHISGVNIFEYTKGDLFIVQEVDAKGVYGFTMSGTSASHYMFDVSYNNGVYLTFIRRGTSQNRIQTFSTAPLNTPFVKNVTQDAVAGVVKIDGVSQTIDINSNQWINRLDNPRRIGLNLYTRGSTSYWGTGNMKVSEVLLFDTNLSAENNALVTNYLMSKYAI